MATQTALAAADITQLGYVALQNYLKNKPIDQVAVQRPLLKSLMFFLLNAIPWPSFNS